MAEEFIADNRNGWKNGKHRQQWTNTLKTYAYPVLGKLPVASIDTDLVLKVLKPIWLTKPETASRVRGRIERVLSAAKVRGLRNGDNPAQWRNHLDAILQAKSKVRRVRHQPALPYTELPAFMSELRALDSVSARALEFCILTASRTNEVIGAKWPEFDLAGEVWTVPASRMKASRPHRVPLSDAALAIIEKMGETRISAYVFPGWKDKAPLSDMAMLMSLRGLRPGYTVHGFRSSFRDWAAECTSCPREIAEAALAHVNGDRTEAAYLRSDLVAKRRELMVAWAQFCLTQQ
jgi:integrase